MYNLLIKEALMWAPQNLTREDGQRDQKGHSIIFKELFFLPCLQCFQLHRVLNLATAESKHSFIRVTFSLRKYLWLAFIPSSWHSWGAWNSLPTKALITTVLAFGGSCLLEGWNKVKPWDCSQLVLTWGNELTGLVLLACQNQRLDEWCCTDSNIKRIAWL